MNSGSIKNEVSGGIHNISDSKIESSHVERKINEIPPLFSTRSKVFLAASPFMLACAIALPVISLGIAFIGVMGVVGYKTAEHFMAALIAKKNKENEVEQSLPEEFSISSSSVVLSLEDDESGIKEDIESEVSNNENEVEESQPDEVESEISKPVVPKLQSGNLSPPQGILFSYWRTTPELANRSPQDVIEYAFKKFGESKLQKFREQLINTFKETEETPEDAFPREHLVMKELDYLDAISFVNYDIVEIKKQALDLRQKLMRSDPDPDTHKKIHALFDKALNSRYFDDVIKRDVTEKEI